MRETRLAVLLVAAALSFFAATYLLSRLFMSNTATSPQTAGSPDLSARRAQIEQTIATTPGVAPFFEKLKEVLPNDYAAAIRRVAETAPGSATDTPDYWLSDAVKRVRQTNGALAAKADAGPLSEIFVKQAAVLTALASRDDRLCVDFLYGGASEGFFAFAAQNRPLVGELAVAGLAAITDGRDKKIEREAPTDADFTALETALKEKGLSPAEIAALLDGKSPEPPLPDARLCEMGRLYLAAIAGLPEETRLRLYALAVGLMARS